MRPLTLVFGGNSRGKSALLRLLPAMASSQTNEPLNLESPALRRARFRDLLCGWKPYDGRLQVTLSWETPRGLRTCEYSLREVEQDGQRHRVVDRLVIDDADGQHVAEWQPNNEFKPSYRFKSGSDLFESEATQIGLSVCPIDSVKRQPFFDALLDYSSLHGRVHWLESVRSVPERSAVLPASCPRRMTSRGVETGAILAYDRLGNRRILTRLSSWFARAGDCTIDAPVTAGVGEDRYSIDVLPTRGEELRVSLRDTGEGLAQVLPVVTMLCMAESGALGKEPVLVLEHPELHLHPRAHEHLAELLMETAKTVPGGSIVVETHSPSLLLRIQLAVAQEEIAPDLVSVHWVRATGEGSSTLDNVVLDAHGVPHGWPPDVFAEDAKLARRLLDVRRARRR